MALSPDQKASWMRLLIQLGVTVLLSGGSAALSAAYVVGKYSGEFHGMKHAMAEIKEEVELLKRNDDGKGIVLTDHTSQLTSINRRISGSEVVMNQMKEDFKDDLRELKQDMNARLDTIIAFLQREQDLRNR